jgi:RNA polymerase sigma-70 factor (ECF subfamily)
LFRADFASVARTVFLIVRDRGRAEDIAQEAVLKTLQNWRVVSGYERPDAWVRRVAIRMAVRHLRRERIRPALEREAAKSEQQRLPDPDVAQAVSALAPMQRAAVVLYYWEDRPVAETLARRKCRIQRSSNTYTEPAGGWPTCCPGR